jgi:hypothetical protein
MYPAGSEPTVTAAGSDLAVATNLAVVHPDGTPPVTVAKGC